MTKRRNNTNPTGRAKYERFVKLPHSMLDSAAWVSLSSKSVAVLIKMMQRYNGSNNGEITFSAREAGVVFSGSKDSGLKALNELMDAGFIRCTRNSGFNVKVRKARQWRLTNWPCNDRSPTNDWKSYTQSATQSASKDRRYDDGDS